jgi:hypothetical protein
MRAVSSPALSKRPAVFQRQRAVMLCPFSLGEADIERFFKDCNSLNF